ncbi:MAG: cob(I)yrinic acid a,c-diamide adenosyltransferase [Patescibacteria group bacterium]|nr:cob(I)yrinic acid a,c-diamide adenosyltransferase [Patescibacteria group bacterium]
MPIYTKKGDQGKTFGNQSQPVLKSDDLIEAFGSVDELSSFIGLVATKVKENDLKLFLNLIQKDLYFLNAFLFKNKGFEKISKKRVKIFEQKIDQIQSKTPKINRFILPFGTELSCWFHVLRIVCRRVERRVVNYLNKNKKDDLNIIIPYLNRLSDLFFVLARWFNNKNKEILV